MKIKRIVPCIVSALILLLFSACSSAAPDYRENDTVKVTFVDNGLYGVSGENADGNTFSIKAGEDLTVTVEPRDGWFLRQSDYPDSRILYGERSATLTLRGVRRSQRVRLTFIESSGMIGYDANGGDFLQAEENIILEPYDISHHIRQNTNIGRDLVREGHTLIGWNTSPDGEGEHIGLGSRVSVTEDENVMLYAEWAAWSDENDFDYMTDGDGESARIVGYGGAAETVCVPAKLGGLPVSEIGSEAFVSCDAKTVILPDTVRTVAQNAFRDCGLKELYLYDNVEKIGDRSFADCPDFETLHINAAEAPKWTNYDRHSNFADKYDILIKYRNHKKIVVFGGSGSYFSVDTKSMTDELADRGYVVINMAINAHFNAYMQFEMIEPYMKAGDALIHIPETGRAQMMAETRTSDVRIWHGLESNFDLVSDIDVRGVDNFFSSFTQFNIMRATRKDGSYSDYVQNIDELGNYGYVDKETGEFTTYKKERGENTPFTYEAAIEPDYLSGDAVMRRKTVYGKFRDKGVRVFLSNAALNVDGLAYELFGGGGGEQEKLQKCGDYARDFDKLNAQAFPEYDILVGIEDCLYDGGRFFNSDYHLGSSGAEEHTARLIGALKRRLPQPRASEIAGIGIALSLCSAQ